MKLTPYQYASNDPINGVDVDGMESSTGTGNTEGATNSNPMFVNPPPSPSNNTTQNTGTNNTAVGSNVYRQNAINMIMGSNSSSNQTNSSSSTTTSSKPDNTSFLQGMDNASKNLTNDFRSFINTVNSPKGPEYLLNTAKNSILGSFEYVLGALGTAAGVSPEDNKFVERVTTDLNSAVDFVQNAPNMTKEQMGEATTYGLVAVGSIIATNKLMGPSSSVSSTASRGASVGLKSGNLTSSQIQMQGVRNMGIAGETATGITGPKTRIPSFTGTANYRIPEKLTPTELFEVKNVAKQGYTSQIQDFNLYSQATGRQFTLFTRSNTELSKPLKAQIQKGFIKHSTIPGF